MKKILFANLLLPVVLVLLVAVGVGIAVQQEIETADGEIPATGHHLGVELHPPLMG